MSTLKGTITEAFTPFHAELLNASSQAEATQEALVELLKKNEGGKTGNAKATLFVGSKEKEVVVAKAMGGFQGIPQ